MTAVARSSKRVTLRSRKLVTDLEASDFVAFPIWEFVMDEAKFDETYVRPLKERMAPNHRHLHIATKFTTASGIAISGFIQAMTFYSPPSYTFPILFLPNGSLDVSEDFLGAEEVRQIEAVLGVTSTQIFPISWELEVPLAQRKKRGSGTISYEANAGDV